MHCRRARQRRECCSHANPEGSANSRVAGVGVAFRAVKGSLRRCAPLTALLSRRAGVLWPCVRFSFLKECSESRGVGGAGSAGGWGWWRGRGVCAGACRRRVGVKAGPWGHRRRRFGLDAGEARRRRIRSAPVRSGMARWVFSRSRRRCRGRQRRRSGAVHSFAARGCMEGCGHSQAGSIKEATTPEGGRENRRARAVAAPDLGHAAASRQRTWPSRRAQ